MKGGDKNSLGKNRVCWHFRNDSLCIRNDDKAPQSTFEFITSQNFFIKTQNVKSLGLAMRPLFTLLVLVKPGEWLTQGGLQDQSLNICCCFPEKHLACNFVTSFWWMLDYSFFQVGLQRWLSFASKHPLYFSQQEVKISDKWQHQARVWINTDYPSALCK